MARGRLGSHGTSEEPDTARGGSKVEEGVAPSAQMAQPEKV